MQIWHHPALQEKELKVLHEKTFTEVKNILNETIGDKPKYENPHAWFETEFHTPASRTQLKQDLMGLESNCRRILGLNPTSYMQSVPNTFKDADGSATVMKLRLWQLGFFSDSQLKGPVASYSVFPSCSYVGRFYAPSEHNHHYALAHARHTAEHQH